MSENSNQDETFTQTQFIAFSSEGTSLNRLIDDSTLTTQTLTLHQRISYYFKRGPLVDWIQGRHIVRQALNSQQMEELIKIRNFYQRHRVSSAFRQHLINILGCNAERTIEKLIQKGYIAQHQTGNILTLTC